ncbi:MAG TPA: hypothetical protein VKX49_29770 [Bryobacteraceae bacterium]|nr:hypothetical protein [Bryobacteraceae bacterium]
MKTLNTALMAGTLLFCASAVSARADFLLNFNSLSSGSNSTAIANYIDGVLGCVGCVTVTGAVADRTYNGENHVVGPNGVSRTLGNTDGATDNSSTATATTNDTFISNITDGSSQISNEMIMSFSGMKLNGTLSFDYEIFPDNSCPNRYSCSGGPPDFEFAVNGSATPVFTTLGVFPSSTGTDGTSTHSPLSGTYFNELSAQYIGTWSGTVSNATELDFIDWPAAIGVDNIHYTSTVPEPRGGAFLIGGLLLAAVAFTKLRHSAVRS